MSGNNNHDRGSLGTIFYLSSSLMENFDHWLVEHGYLASGETVFGQRVPEKTLLFICVWIMSLYMVPLAMSRML